MYLESVDCLIQKLQPLKINSFTIYQDDYWDEICSNLFDLIIQKNLEFSEEFNDSAFKKLKSYGLSDCGDDYSTILLDRVNNTPIEFLGLIKIESLLIVGIENNTEVKVNINDISEVSFKLIENNNISKMINELNIDL